MASKFEIDEQKRFIFLITSETNTPRRWKQEKTKRQTTEENKSKCTRDQNETDNIKCESNEKQIA